MNKKSVFFFKGSVTVFALLLMFILAVTTIGIISTAAIERRVSISTGNSTTAFQIAESGMEKTLQDFKSNFDRKLSDISCLGNSITSGNNTIKFRVNGAAITDYASCDKYISDIKVIKSIGTTKQETRAIEEDVFFGATKLLLHLNGENDSGKFEDSSFYWNNHAVTITGGVSAESDNSLIKLGEGSAKFDGTGYLSVPNSSDWDFNTGDFTIDLWVNFASVPLIRQNLISPFLYYENGNLYGLNGAEVIPSWTPSIGTWYHIALVRWKGNFSMYVDGSPKISHPNATDIINSSSLDIGTNFDGYIDEIRISKGIARWTSNFSSRLPNAEYWPD